MLDGPVAPPKKENEGMYALSFILCKETLQGIAVLLVMDMFS